MVCHVISGLLLLVLTPVVIRAGLATICEDLCSNLPYAGNMDECVQACELLVLSELENSAEEAHDYEGGYEGNGIEDELYAPADKRGMRPRGARQKSTFVRIGRSVDGLLDNYDEQAIDGASKRASAFVRIGRNRLFPFQDDKRTSSFVRIGKKSDEEVDKRASSFVRIGRPSSFVRIGRDPQDKRPSSFVRIGRPGSGFVRIGKSVEQTAEKRPSSFVRIGKSMDTESDLMSPADNADLNDDDKRASSFVRIGKSVGIPAADSKRTSTFVRIGKGFEEGSQDGVKRASNFVRIGKSIGDADGDNKRASKFVRIGKRSTSS